MIGPIRGNTTGNFATGDNNDADARSRSSLQGEENA